MTGRRPRVLALIGALWPGNDASGANISLRAAAAALSGDIDLTIFARDRAFGAAEPHPQAQARRDNGVDYRYLPVGRFGPSGLVEAIAATPHDLLWLNGFYDRDFTLPVLIARRLGRLPRAPALLSPRGEFADGAMATKSARKRGWLALTRWAGLLSGVTLHATGPDEHRDIARGCPWAASILDAPNIRPPVEPPAFSPAPEGPLRVAFVGRIAKVKNLHVAIEALAATTTPVAFDIYGPASDAAYWADCRARIAALPAHVSVTAHGEIAQEAVPEALAASDLLFLPTAGENFGHAIFEALSCGVPTLISDRTPWRGMADARAGWDLPLGDPAAFAKTIDAYAALSPAERRPWREGARARALQWLEAHDGAAAHLAMFRKLI